MPQSYRDQYGNVYHQELDPNVWLTIPQLAEKMGVSVAEAGEILDLLGLRWKGPRNRYRSKIPTGLATTFGFCAYLDNGKESELKRWHYDRIMALMRQQAEQD